MKHALLALALASLLFADAQTLFRKCQICHGKYAEKPMGSKIAPNSLTTDQISYALTKYRDSFQTSSGNTKIMATNVRRFSDQDIADMAIYIKELQAQRKAELEEQALERLKGFE
jgi:cytochrome c553